MKKIIFCCSLLFVFFGCQTMDENTFVLNGQTDIEDGKRIFRIKATTNNTVVRIDTATVSKGKFVFEGDVDHIDINFLMLEGSNVNAAFIMEEGVINVNMYKDSLQSMKIQGTISNDDLQRYRDQTNSYANSLNSIVTEINTANMLNDNLLVKDLQEQYLEIKNELDEYELNFVKLNNDSYVASLLLERILSQKVLAVSEVSEIFSTYSSRIRSSRSGNNIARVLNSPRSATAIGELAPLFSGPTPSGEIIALEDFKGKVLIVDFWASWCMPCRKANPNLVRLYNKMHGKGLEILGVSLDRNKASWERAISDDGLNWYHVSNLKYWRDPIAQLYGIRSIPTALILDREGRIVAKNLYGAQLDRKIEELLAN